MKILVVDDDPHLRALLSITLERSGFDVLTAADGQIALTHAARERPDLIVLDVGLPEIDGFEVCRRLRTKSEVPVLFLDRAGRGDRPGGRAGAGRGRIMSPSRSARASWWRGSGRS